MKRFTLVFTILLIYTTLASAQTYTSLSYTLMGARIAVSGGTAGSLNYSLENVTIGSFTAGKAESASYSLEKPGLTIGIGLTEPDPPTLEPVSSPTNVSTQTLSGTKEKWTAIYINGYEAVPLNSETTWSYEKALTEGTNLLIITAIDIDNLESKPVLIGIILDTVPPEVIITAPLDGTITHTSPIAVEWTLDGAPFSVDRGLNLGLNEVTIEASDKAGNTSSDSIEVYLIRTPLLLP